MQIDERAGTHGQKPRVKLLSRPRAHHLHKLLYKEVGLIDLWIKSSQSPHGFLFFRSKVFRTAQKQPGSEALGRKCPFAWSLGSVLASISGRCLDKLSPYILIGTPTY